MRTKIIKFPHYIDEGNDLIVLEGNTVPFVVTRVFFVRAKKGSLRGQHAHKHCSQLMTCISGSVEILCDDGINQKTYLLDDPSIGLNVVPGVWAEQRYLEDSSILAVFCDRQFEQSDYIHDYNEFKSFIE